MNIFPEETITTTETHILAELMNNPVAKKYFRIAARNAVLGIAKGEPDDGESDAAYLRRAAFARGVLTTFETLLAIEVVKKDS